jgi:NAD(P)H-hydrate epimerase
MVVLTVPGERGGGSMGEVVGCEAPSDAWADAAAGDLARFGALVLGPGLGRGASTQAEVRRLLAAAEVPTVLDADGLHAVAGSLDVVGRRRGPTVLTPHEGEFAALRGSAPGADRIGSVRDLAAATGACVLLKGAVTVVAAPDGAVLIVANGDQRLATAGTGDVLAGMIGAALAGGVDPLHAAASAAWLHAAVADTLPADGLLAGDIPDAIPSVVAGLRARP